MHTHTYILPHTDTHTHSRPQMHAVLYVDIFNQTTPVSLRDFGNAVVDNLAKVQAKLIYLANTKYRKLLVCTYTNLNMCVCVCVDNIAKVRTKLIYLAYTKYRKLLVCTYTNLNKCLCGVCVCVFVCVVRLALRKFEPNSLFVWRILSTISCLCAHIPT